MVDVVNAATRSRMMAGIKAANTKPEVFLRKALHAAGLRYRLGNKFLPGNPDLVFPSRHAVVLVHGCFWHRHECRYFKWPDNNRAFWEKKLSQNAARDSESIRRLDELGWRSIIVWECKFRETRYSLPNPIVTRVIKALRSLDK